MSDFLTPLVAISDQKIALLFSNYLASQGIAAKVEPNGQNFDIYCSISHRDVAKVMFDEFILHPYHEKYQQAAWNIAKPSKLASDDKGYLTEFQHSFFAHAGIVTLTIFSLCWLVFLGSIAGFAVPIFHQLQFYPTFHSGIFFQQPWRIVSPALFHFSWLHIVFNVLWWWQLGGDIERKLRSSVLLQLFLLSAVISNVGQYYVSGPNFGGLSGVVYGLVGFVSICGWLAPHLTLGLPKPIITMLVLWMVLGFMEILPMNMANMAHLLGLISGALFALLYLAFHGHLKPKSH